MYLTKTFISNFLYGGLVMGVLLTTIDVIKESNKNISFYAFLSGSFILINLIQYYYIHNNNNNDNTYAFLIHSIIGGIVWVIYAILLYYLYTLKINKYINIFIIVLITIVTTFIYYVLFINDKLKNVFIK
jgi:mannose/fructose/N-acetylgalactosamine-specific phosphotransferase system component IID